MAGGHGSTEGVVWWLLRKKAAGLVNLVIYPGSRYRKVVWQASVCYVGTCWLCMTLSVPCCCVWVHDSVYAGHQGTCAWCLWVALLGCNIVCVARV